MRLIAKLIAVLLVCCLLVPASAEQEPLTDEQLRELLYELGKMEEGAADFIVLPDDFRMPTTSLAGEYRLLILGTDVDGPRVQGRSDTMVLAVLNTRQRSLRLVSFMRDLYVQIPGRGHNRLNACYAFGGEPLLKRTLEGSFGVAYDGFVAVNYSLFIDLVDAIGGVELTVQPFELKSLNGILEYYNRQHKRPKDRGRLRASGTHVLTGLQAMSYARIRKPDSDFERVVRQQKVLKAILQRLEEMGPLEAVQALTPFVDRISTDLSLSDAIGLAADMQEMGSLSVDTLSIPVKGSYAARMIRGTWYLVPNLNKNKEALRVFMAAPGPQP